jgi:hypothetical protein
VQGAGNGQRRARPRLAATALKRPRELEREEGVAPRGLHQPDQRRAGKNQPEPLFEDPAQRADAERADSKAAQLLAESTVETERWRGIGVGAGRQDEPHSLVL